ncbi:MAG TPA: dihydrodipicolinate synthase family protein, partial [Lacibacter sp.]|nr:dihydrodipicolinate synthase family protein [Lacibacter sp.]
MSFEWKGVFPALLTPFTANEEVDLAMFEKNLKAQLDAGVHGVIIGGSLGEASTITAEEKETLIKHAIKYLNGKIPVIMNIAESTTKDAVQQAANAKAWGAAGLMLLPPMRYKSDDRETVEYFKTIAKSTDLPVMIYNNP